MGKPKPEHRDLVREVKREVRRVRAAIEPGLIAKAGEPGQEHLDQDFRNVIIAQNVLHPCMVATMEEMRPFGHLLCLELATRLASYALSAAPAQDQDKLVELLLMGLPEAHKRRLEQGIIIQSHWREEDGSMVPNHIPEPQGNA